MIYRIDQISKLSGIALTDKIGFGKHSGKHLWEIPESYWRYMSTTGSCNADIVICKSKEAKEAFARIPKVQPANELPVYTASDIEAAPFTLRPPQHREIMRFPGRNRVLINGAIGSGKTIIALMMSHLYGYRKTLIICPRTIHSSFAEKIQKFTGKSVIRLYGPVRDRVDMIYSTNAQFYIINPEVFSVPDKKIGKDQKYNERMDALIQSRQELTEAIAAARFEFAIMDEAHLYLQNHSNATYKALRTLQKYIPAVYPMTGTVYTEGRLERAVDLLHFMNPALFGGRAITSIYKELFELDSYYRPAAPKPGTRELISRIMAENSMVITKEELKLPTPVEEIVEVEMSGDWLDAYMRAWKSFEIMAGDETIEITAKIAQITRLRQISGGSVLGTRFKNNKIQTMLDVVSEYGTESFGVVCQYHEDIALVSDALAKAGYKFGVISGKITGPNRDRVIADFRARRIQGIILQQGTGGVGIDGIQEISRFCCQYSGSYSSSQTEQTDGRWVRDGQLTNAVFHRIHAVLPGGEFSQDQLMAMAVKLKIETSEEFMKFVLVRLAA